MKKHFLIPMFCVALFSCSKSDVDIVHTPAYTERTPVASGRVGDECEITTAYVPLLAGQYMNAGELIITHDDVDLTVTYNTINNWRINEIHLYIGEYANAPQNNAGNPVPGRFPIKATFANPGVTTYTYTMPLSSLPECFIVAAHAVVKDGTAGGAGTQTGWAQGAEFPGNNWGMYVNYCTYTCP